MLADKVLIAARVISMVMTVVIRDADDVSVGKLERISQASDLHGLPSCV